MQGLIFEEYKEKEKIDIEDGMLKLRKISRIYKDYSSSFYKIWLKAFINYTLIIVFLFGLTTPWLQAALAQFYGLVLQLLKVYNWKKVLLPLAIEFHLHIIIKQPSDPSNG